MYPSVETLAAETSLHQVTVSDALTSLVEKRALVIDGSRTGGRNKSTHYRIGPALKRVAEGYVPASETVADGYGIEPETLAVGCETLAVGYPNVKKERKEEQVRTTRRRPEAYEFTCAECGEVVTQQLPFEPNDFTRCRDCFQKRKKAKQEAEAKDRAEAAAGTVCATCGAKANTGVALLRKSPTRHLCRNCDLDEQRRLADRYDAVH
jgi:hypothetical protein